ncbi:hypothetical protein ACAX43_12485 [Paraburkholderia sp. IW21]|uniref:hypothetical protein n=1 Tax=Paraburkholderia sp. IW21 TaxID=3242488 RepID=UPI00351FB8BD
MSRPAPKIIVSDYNKKTHYNYDVLEQPAMYGIAYEGKLVTARSGHEFNEGTRSYRRTVFPDKGRALSLADKLNERFHTDKFEVYMLAIGEQIVREVAEEPTKGRGKKTSKGTSKS